MPKVIGFTPPWLARPSPGSQAFADLGDHSESAQVRNQARYFGQRRSLAQRGTEVFVAVGNQIRWLDLRPTKHAWEDDRVSPKLAADLSHHQQQDSEEPEGVNSKTAAYRVRLSFSSNCQLYLPLLTYRRRCLFQSIIRSVNSLSLRPVTFLPS